MHTETVAIWTSILQNFHGSYFWLWLDLIPTNHTFEFQWMFRAGLGYRWGFFMAKTWTSMARVQFMWSFVLMETGNIKLWKPHHENRHALITRSGYFVCFIFSVFAGLRIAPRRRRRPELCSGVVDLAWLSWRRHGLFMCSDWSFQLIILLLNADWASGLHVCPASTHTMGV